MQTEHEYNNEESLGAKVHRGEPILNKRNHTYDFNFWKDKTDYTKQLHDVYSYEEADRQLHLDTQHEIFFGFLLMLGIVAGAAYALYIVLS